MTSTRIHKFSIFGVLLSLLCLGNKTASAQADPAIYIGTDPQTSISLPAVITKAVAFDEDAEHNRYYVDAAQSKLFRVDTAGVVSTVATDIGQADIDVNWKGDVLVADTTHNRIVLETASLSGYQEIVLATLPAPKNILAMKGGHNFFLSGDSLYQLSGSGTPQVMATIEGALSISRGPNTKDGGSIYILSVKNNVYQLSVYNYSGQSGSLGTQTPLPIPGPVLNFHVDPFGNYLFQTGASDSYQIVSVGSPGSPLPGLTKTLFSGSSPHNFFTFDKIGKLSFPSGSQVAQIQFKEIDLGTYAFSWDTRFPEAWTNLKFAKQEWDEFWEFYAVTKSGPFQALYPYDSYGCWGSSPNGLCTMPIGIYTTELGSSIGEVTAGDWYDFTFTGRAVGGRTVLVEPALKNQVQIPSTLVARPTYIEPYVKDFTLQKIYVIDQATNQLDIINGPNPPKEVLSNDVANANSLAVGLDGVAYVTQKNIPGVKRIAADGATTQLYTQFEHPTGWATDIHSNIFISDNDRIYTIRNGEAEAVLYADPAAVYGLQNLVTLKCHVASGSVYVAYSSGGPRGVGGIVKISPTGKMTLRDIKVDAIAGFGLDDGQNLYVSDAKRKVVALETASGKELVLVKGLKTPLAVAASNLGLYGVADPGSGAVIGATGSGYDGLNFGDVPLGTSSTRIFYVINRGSAADGAGFGSHDENPDFTSNGADLAAGDFQILSTTFQPHALGSSSLDYLFSTQWDYVNHYPPYYDLMTGNGVAAELAPARFSLVLSGLQTHGQGTGIRVLALNAAGKIITGYSRQLLLQYTGPFAGAALVNLTNGVGTATLDGLCPGVYTVTLEEGTAKGQLLVTVKDQGIPAL